MLTTLKWRERSEMNMMKAQHVHGLATSQCDKSKQVHDETVLDNHDTYSELHGNLKQKVADSHFLVAKLEERGKSLETSIKSTRQSLADLEEAIRAKDPPLQLCLWRLEQRSRRPVREQVRDAAEVALEEERTTLVSLKWELGDIAERARAIIAELSRKLADVQHDVDHKVNALGIDEMCLMTTQSSFHSMTLRTPRPQAAQKRSNIHTPSTESQGNEQARQQRATNLDGHAATCEEKAAVLRAEAAQLIARCAEKAAQAKAAADRAMEDRLSQIQQTKLKLEQEIKQTDATIDHTNGVISETRFHLSALDEPIVVASTCSDWRKRRTAAEHITDPVSTSLHGHHSSLLKAHESLSEQHQAEKANLDELCARKRQLLEDLKDKTLTHQIDSRCLMHGSTPRASSAVRAPEKSANPMPLPIHGDPVPGKRPTINGFGNTVTLGPGSLSARGPPGSASTRGAASKALASTADTLGFTPREALASTRDSMGFTAPGYLSSWKLARNGHGTMTPRSTSTGTTPRLPTAARAAMTF